MDTLTLYFDRTFGKRLPRALASLKPPVEIRWHQQQNFPQDMPDDEWLEIVSNKGWIVLSQDLHFHLRDNEKATIMQHEGRCFYFPCANEDRWYSMCLFVRRHLRLLELSDGRNGPFIYEAQRPTLLGEAMTDKSKKQIDKFKEAARELETDDREEAFDERLKRVAKTVVPPKEAKPNRKR